MKTKHFSAVLTVLLVMSGCSSDSSGPTGTNQQTGSVTGLVQDAGNAAVVNATVTLSATGQTSRTQQSGNTGNYTFTAVAVGTWTVSVSPPTGYTIPAAGASKTVVVTANSTVTADVIRLDKTPAGPAPMAASVDISGFAYSPVNVVVAQGGTVTWTNKDSAAHTATGSGFDTGSLAQNASKALTFATKGTFDYVCTFHSNMRGTVTVQ